MKQVILSIALGVFTSAALAGNGPSMPDRGDTTRPEPKWSSGGAIQIPDLSKNNIKWDRK